MHVHHLSEITDQGRTIITGCGQKLNRQPTDRLPKEVTAWGSEVTCPACLARQPSRG